MLCHNYEKEEIRKNQELILKVPLRLEVYEHFEPLFKQGLGSLYQTSIYISARKNDYTNAYVMFQRFCFDFLSLSGTFIYQLTLTQ